MILSRRINCLLALIAGLSSTVAAIELPPLDKLEFSIVRNGSEIGHHDLFFKRRDGIVEVVSNTAIDFKLGFIPLYRFRQEGREVWRENRLEELRTLTDDNGTSLDLAIARESDGLKVSLNGAVKDSLPEAIPASLWHRRLTEGPLLIDTVDGDRKTVTVQDIGDEAIIVRGIPTVARRFTVEGEMQRDVWYDKNDALVQVRFTARDGSEILYRLR
jgi:hypothetical protein